LHPAGLANQQLCGFQPAPKRSVRVLTRGEEAEFANLVERQSRFVFRVAYAVLLNASDAEDAVQETFLKLYRNGGWRGMDNERAFLARVAWRVAVDRPPRTSQPAAEPIDSADATPSLEPGPEHAAISANQHALVHSLIDALPEDLRVPLLLSSFEELNSREIGEALGIPEGTVRTRLHRARQMLREKLTTLRSRNSEARYV
jgi:RNA polymerase sigma-70 factor (ECF subfamily)